jgi:hypothetical protein
MMRRVRWVLTFSISAAVATFVLASMLAAGPSGPVAATTPPGPSPAPRIHFIGTNAHPITVATTPAPGS